MSDQTRRAVDDAIRAHAADEWGEDLVVDWTVVVGTIDHDDLTGVGMIHSREKMPGYIAKGLLVDALDDIRAGSYDTDLD